MQTYNYGLGLPCTQGIGLCRTEHMFFNRCVGAGRCAAARLGVGGLRGWLLQRAVSASSRVVSAGP